MAKTSILLTHGRLKDVMHYDPDTGVFTRNRDHGLKCKKGEIVGTREKRGYLRITIDYRNYRAHRLAWFYMTGVMPINQIDHIDLDKSNDRFSNLREATHSQNLFNCSRRKRNTSGFKGVSWSKAAKKWTAQISFNGKHKYLGVFESPEAAHAAYVAASKIVHENFCRAN